MYTNYSYERVRVTDINEFYQNPEVLQRATRSCATRCCSARTARSGNERIISKVTPTVTHNTVDHPIFPTAGKR